MKPSRGRAVRVAILASIALLAASCTLGQSSSPSGELAALHVVNVDGPDVSVLLADKTVAVVQCGSSATVAPGGPLPYLPWELTVRTSDGEVLQSVSVTGLPETVLIRGRGVITGPWPMTYGPAPQTTCPPEQAQSAPATVQPSAAPVASDAGETLALWPPAIAGEPVLAVADVAGRVSEGPGSFLVGGFVHLNAMSCITGQWLAPLCGYYFLVPGPSQRTPGLKLSSPGADVQIRQELGDLLGHAVVVRVHAHDPAASACPPIYRVACDTATVIESIVWPTSP